MSLFVVKPTVITSAMLVGTDVPEADYSAWSSTTAYAIGQRVILLSTHKVYECIQAGTGKSPDTETAYWSEVGPTNRWKLFDLSNTTQTLKSGSMYYELKTGSMVNGLAVLNLTGAQSIRVRVTDPVFGVVYDKSTSLTSIPPESGWYAWFFSERIEQVQHIALDLPSYPSATVRVDLAGTSALAVGVLMVGQQRIISDDVKFGTRIGIRDYSRKEKNEWGDITLVERAYSKTRSFAVMIPKGDVDRVELLLASMRAKGCLYVDDSLSNMAIYGFPSNFEIVIAYAKFSDCSIDIEGLT